MSLKHTTDEKSHSVLADLYSACEKQRPESLYHKIDRKCKYMQMGT